MDTSLAAPIATTQSLCPQCLERIPARVVRKKQEVFLEKTCHEHGRFSVLVEKDADFYLAARACSRSNGPPKTPGQFVFIATHRCNMKCRLCYVPYRDAANELSVEEVARLLDRTPCNRIQFAGGEPTVMDNLPRMIEVTRSRGRMPMIVTNGLKLADKAYVSELAQSGIYAVILSLNALSPRILEKVDGRDILDAKMRAIENLKRHGIPFITSFSLVSEVNEAEMLKVLKFTARQAPRAKGFLMENMPKVGRQLSDRTIHLSEILRMCAKSVGVSLESLVEMARSGRAELSPYTFAADLDDVLALGNKPARRLRSGFFVRFLSSPNADTADLSETAYVDRIICASKTSPVLPLWEYLVRYQGRDVRALQE